MLFSGKWFDPVIGIDIHIIQPPGPVPPIPVPHPFIGIVFDPAGLMVGMAINAAMSGLFGGSFSGPVLINGMPAANTGTEVKGMPIHIPIGGVFVNPPSNEGTIITGSKTVHIMGSSGARLTSMVTTCNDPINLPTSLLMAIPMGDPVCTGGPTGVDILAAILAGIRTKWVSEFLHDILKIKPGSWLSRIVCFMTGHPVDVVTGRLLTDQTDFTLPGPLPIKFERTYYSASIYSGPLGYGWHHSYDQHISIRGGSIFLRAEDGREIEFDPIEVGESLYQPVERLELNRHSDGFTVRTSDRRVLHFGVGNRTDSRYPLTRIEDLNGNAIRLQYLGDCLASITDSAGRKLELGRDAEGRLSVLEAPDPRGGGGTVPVARYEYDLAGDLVGVFDGLGSPFRYTYRNHLLVQETNRNNLSFYFEYDEYEPEGRCVHTWGDGGIYDHHLKYQREAHLTIVENSLGAKTTYLWNDACLVTRIVDALGKQTIFAWDDCGRKVAETDGNGHTTLWKFDENGNQTKAQDALGLLSEEKYNRFNLPVERTDANGNRWTWEYDERGNCTSSRNPVGGQWTYEYDHRGSLIREIDPLGGETRFAVNERCEVVQWTTPADVSKQFAYDSIGRVVQITHSPGIHTSYEYGFRDRLARIRWPDGSVISYEYDPEGNLVKVVDTKGRETCLSYCGYNQPAERRDASGSSQRFVYDAEENLIEVHNERGEVYRAERDLVERVCREVDFDGGEWRYDYDAIGNLRALTDPAGCVSIFVRDSRGRLLRKLNSEGVESSFGYDALGRLTEAHAPGSDVVLRYDRLGNVVSESQNGRVLEQTYDLLGRPTRRRSPAGTVVEYAYNSDGELRRLQTPGGTILFEYDARGRVARLDYPGNVQETRSYDVRGRLSEQVVRSYSSEVVRRAYQYDSEGNLTEFADLAKGKARFRYDQVDRLAEVDRYKGNPESFTFDPTGNLLQRGDESFQYASGGRLVQEGDMVWEYDKAGNPLERKGESSDTSFTYDGDNRLTAVVFSEDDRIEFAYDAFGRRTSKRRQNQESKYVWDGELLLTEQMGTHSVEYLFQPGGFEPLCRLRDGEFEAYLTDNLGTPQEIIDSAGRIRWSGCYDVYGRVERLEVGEVTNLLRFQGQYEDPETGLHYNRFRYYDPGSGRYTTPDPIGMYAGLNPYRYTPNPLRWVDPLGLSCKIGSGGLEIGWGGKWRIRLFHLAPGGRFDIFVVRYIIRAEVHPISQKLPQWLKVPHFHLDFLPGAWSHVHFPWEFYPGMLRGILTKLGL